MVEINVISGSMWEAETKDRFSELHASRKQTNRKVIKQWLTRSKWKQRSLLVRNFYTNSFILFSAAIPDYIYISFKVLSHHNNVWRRLKS